MCIRDRGGGCLAAALLAAFLQKGEGSFLPALLLAVSGVLLVLFAGFERSRAGAQAVVLIALLSAVSCAGRVLFAGLPSVQPSSSLIILTGIVFGPQAGFMTGAMTALTSNMLLGQGPWTVWQMSAWGMMGLSSGLLQRLLKRLSLIHILLRANGIKRLMLEAERVTLSQAARYQAMLPDVELDTGDGLDQSIDSLRMVKSAGEKEQIIRAQRIAEQAFDHILTFIRPRCV